jgi:hypothetical protein
MMNEPKLGPNGLFFSEGSQPGEDRGRRYNKLFRDEVAKLRKDQGSISVIPWSSVIVPANASDLERLTYVPGLVGDITEWIVRSAPRPNRMMALAAATVTVGTIIGRYVRGPTGSATHLYIIMLAPTGYGKDWPLQAGPKLLDAVGRPSLVGPSEWTSSVGLTQALEENPLMCCFIDEFGDEIATLNSQKQNPFVWKTLGLLKKTYNAWSMISTAATRHHESVRIDWPALSVVGAATPEAFFGAFLARDVKGGIVNRIVSLPYEGLKRPPEQQVPKGAQEPPRELVAKLKLLPKFPDILQRNIDGLPTPLDIPWGPGASECYIEFSREMDKNEQGDPQRYELGMRVTENSARFATDIAVGRFSPTVDLEDISHAIAICKLSYEAMLGGITSYMREYFEFPDFCNRVAEEFGEREFISKRDLNRKFFRNMRMGFELDNVVNQLKKQALIEPAHRTPSTGGPIAEGWRWIGD